MHRKLTDLLMLDDKASQYIIKEKLGIQTVLKKLKKSKSLVTVYINEYVSFLSPIVELDNTNIYLDMGPDQKLNELLLKSQHVICTTFEDRIKIQFELSSIIEDSFEGLPILKCKMPDMLLRLQRREHYRVDIPKNYQVYCTYKDTDEIGEATTVRLSTVDISGGGLSARGFTDSILTKVSKPLGQCKLHLHDLGDIIVDCQVCYIQHSDDTDISKSRAGLKFLNISDSDIMRIQRFVMQVERQKKI